MIPTERSFSHEVPQVYFHWYILLWELSSTPYCRRSNYSYHKLKFPSHVHVSLTHRTVLEKAVQCLSFFLAHTVLTLAEPG